MNCISHVEREFEGWEGREVSAVFYLAEIEHALQFISENLVENPGDSEVRAACREALDAVRILATRAGA